MSNIPKTQVSTKFQNMRKSVITAPVQKKVALTIATTRGPNRMPLAMRSAKFTANEKPGKAEDAISEPPAELPTKSATNEIQVMGNVIAHAATIAKTTTRGRTGSATLPRKAPVFNALSRRVYRSVRSNVFDYDLSKEEKRLFGQSSNAMKSVPADELQILRSGQRSTYLETRYERTPDAKYNYPEATSWRYGWFHAKAP